MLLRSADVLDIYVEPFIHSGFRLPNQPYSYYYRSLFFLHNESLSVWIHLLGTLILIGQVYQHILQLSSMLLRFYLIYNCFGACVMLLCSAQAHLLHSRTLADHLRSFYLDYFGINFYGFTSGIILEKFSHQSKFFANATSTHEKNVRCFLFLSPVGRSRKGPQRKMFHMPTNYQWRDKVRRKVFLQFVLINYQGRSVQTSLRISKLIGIIERQLNNQFVRQRMAMLMRQLVNRSRERRRTNISLAIDVSLNILFSFWSRIGITHWYWHFSPYTHCRSPASAKHFIVDPTHFHTRFFNVRAFSLFIFIRSFPCWKISSLFFSCPMK